MRKLIFFLMILTIFTEVSFAQLIYNSQEGNRQYVFGQVNGILDSSAVNPGPDDVNSRMACIKYRRSKEEIYDNIKISFPQKFSNVSTYATYEGNPPKIRMMVYSTAPVGTQIELQLGKHNEIAYPDGVHSQYQAVTTKQNQWEEIEFLFAAIPEGSKVSASEVDQLTILFAPKTQSNYIFYFDQLNGPELLTN